MNEAPPHAQLSTQRALLTYIDEHRIRLNIGSSPSRFVGGALIGAFVLAGAMVLVSNLSFGAKDPYLPNGLGGGSISAGLTLASLILSGVFLATAAWYTVGSNSPEASPRFSARNLIPIGVAVVNVVVGLSLISTAATIRTTASLFDELPSLIPANAGGGDLSLALGTTVLVSCVLFLAVIAFAPHQRTLAMSLAALPAMLCAIAFAFADRNGLQLSNWAKQRLLSQSSSATIRYIEAAASARIATAPLLVLVLGSTAFLGLLVAFGVAEFVDAKAKLGRFLVGLRRIPTWVVALLLGAVAVVWLVGRAGWLPDGRDAVAAFYATAPEAWIVAALMALGGLATLRAAYRRPFERRNARAVVAIACVSLVTGEIVLFISNLLQELGSPLVSGSSAVGRFIFERLPQWSVWFATWSTFLTSIGLGLWATWRITQRERSDRVVFAMAFFVVVFPLRLSAVLVEHDAARGVWSYHNATPDLIALTAIAIVAIAILARKPLFDNRTTAVVVSVLFLITLLDAVVPEDFAIGTFQMLLVAPFAYRFLFNSDGLRADRTRAAITVAGIGLLFVANSAAIATGGLTSEAFETGELFSFLQLTAPLALLVLCRTAPLPEDVALDDATTSDAPALAPRGNTIVRVTALVTLAFVAGVMAFAVVRLPGKPERGPYQVDVAFIPDDFTPQQSQFGSAGEEVTLTNGGSTIMFISHLRSTNLDPCGDDTLNERFGVAPTEPVREVEPVGGLPTVSGLVADASGITYTLTCGSEVEGDVSRAIVVFEGTAELSTGAQSVVDSVVFRTLLVPNSTPADEE